MRNFTKMSTAAILLLSIVFIACNKDEEPPAPVIPDPSGVYTLTTAELVDPDPLEVANYPGISDPIAAGPTSIPQLTPIIGALLASIACENPADYSSYTLELAADGTLIFNCVAAAVSDDSGSWSLTQDDDGNYTKLNFFIEVNGNPYTIALDAVAVTDSNLSGTALNLPIQQDAANPIPPVGTGTLTIIQAKLVLTKQ